MNFVVERPERFSHRPPGTVAHKATAPDSGTSLCGQITGGIPTDDAHAAALTQCPVCATLTP